MSTEPEVSDAPVPERVVGERSIASVNQARSLQSRISNFLALGLMSSLALGLTAWYYAHTWTHHADRGKAAQAASRNQAAGEMPLPPLGRIDPPATVAAQVLGPAPPLPAASSAPNASAPAAMPPGVPPYGQGPYGPQATPQKSRAELALERRLAGPVSLGPGVSMNQSTAAPVASDLGTPGAPGAVPAALDPMGELLKPTVTPAVSARVLPTERLLLPKGAFIDCTLETAIDSTLPGMTSCITATDTFGADGSTVLIERGAKLIGETRGEVAQGQARIFVLWSEARTPSGVVVPLASPGTDELGRSGLSGEVNRHFWQRFGAAILISVIDGAIQGAIASQGNGGTVIYSPQASTDVMTEVLKSTINIPPTITKRQGDRIEVFVARDLDFRSVYELKARADAR